MAEIRSVMVVALLAACACSRPVGASASPSQLPSLPDEQDPGRLVPRGAPARAYQSEPIEQRGRALFGDGLRASILDGARQIAAEHQVAIVGDSRLSAAMDEIARSLGDETAPDSEEVEFLLSYYGVVEPYPTFLLLRAARATDQMMAAEVLRSFEVTAENPIVSLGVGIDSATSYVTVVVAAQAKHLDLTPVPRALPSRATIALSGRVRGRFAHPHLYVTYPTGEAARFGLVGSGEEFRSTIACDRGDGRYQIEVFGQDRSGPRVLANFPVYCGASPPEAFTRRIADASPPLSAAEAERELLRLVNKARSAAGLGSLRVDELLAEVARAHSEDMVRNAFFAHISPATGSPADRAEAAGVVLDQLLENIARSGSAREAHDGLMGSPGHRSAILDPTVTHVGIGVVVSTAADGVATVTATELFR